MVPAVSTDACVLTPRLDGLGADGAPVRLGLFGGTFDPVHYGHLACAQQAQQALGLAGVAFVPAGAPAFKRHRRVLAAEHRVELCRLAVRDNPLFEVSTIEVDRPGITYAVDTLQTLRDFYPPNVELCFIMGADAALSLPRWRDSGRLASLARFAVAARPGFELSPKERAELAAAGFSIEVFPVVEQDISSSALRACAAERRSLRYLVPEAVRERIEESGWYEKEGQAL